MPVRLVDKTGAVSDEQQNYDHFYRDNRVVEVCRFADADHQQRDHQSHDEHGGQVQETAGRLQAGRGVVRERRSRQRGRQGQPEILEKADDIGRPAHGNGGCAEQIFKNQIPPNDPGKDLPQCGVGVRVGATRRRHHGCELGVAESCERAGDAGKHKRQRDRRTRIAGCRLAGQHKDAGADHTADPEQREVHRAQHPFELMPGRQIREHVVTRFGSEETFHLLTLRCRLLCADFFIFLLANQAEFAPTGEPSYDNWD